MQLNEQRPLICGQNEVEPDDQLVSKWFGMNLLVNRIKKFKLLD